MAINGNCSSSSNSSRRSGRCRSLNVSLSCLLACLRVTERSESRNPPSPRSARSHVLGPAKERVCCRPLRLVCGRLPVLRVPRNKVIRYEARPAKHLSLSLSLSHVHPIKRPTTLPPTSSKLGKPSETSPLSTAAKACKWQKGQLFALRRSRYCREQRAINAVFQSICLDNQANVRKRTAESLEHLI